MDAKKFGAFIAAMRKEKQMTQMDLAEKLHVTDKAVSRWERGLGFPDIKTIEPLADALGISILELMRSERMEAEVAPDTADAALTDLSALAEQQVRNKQKKLVLVYDILFLILCCALLIFRGATPQAGPIPLEIWVFVVLFGIPRIVMVSQNYQGSGEERKAFRKMVLRSVWIALAIMFCVIAGTVLYAVIWR